MVYKNDHFSRPLFINAHVTLCHLKSKPELSPLYIGFVCYIFYRYLQLIYCYIYITYLLSRMCQELMKDWYNVFIINVVQKCITTNKASYHVNHCLYHMNHICIQKKTFMDNRSFKKYTSGSPSTKKCSNKYTIK